MSLSLLLRSRPLPVVAVEIPEPGLQLRIDGVDVMGLWREGDGTLSYDDQLNTRSHLTVTLIDDTNEFRCEPGESVVFREARGTVGLLSSDGDRIVTSNGDPLIAVDIESIFGGTIERTQTHMEGTIDSTYRTVTIEAVSFDQIADRHHVAEIYEDMFAGDIVRDFIDELLEQDGVTAESVEDGPILEFILFNYVTVAEAMNKLSALTGFAWWIDADKIMHFQRRDSAPAPYRLTDEDPEPSDDAHAQTIMVVKSRERYRNRQIIRAGRDLTDPRPETFVGDGERKTFNVAFPVGEEPDIEVNGIPQAVGIRGVEEGFDWYWNKDTTEISQDDAATALDVDDQMIVTYRGLFSVVVIVQSDVEIAERRAIEGGSGKYENVTDEPNIDSAAVASDTALAYLDRDGRLPTTLTWTTQQYGLKAGMLIPASLIREDAEGEFLIIAVQASYVGDSRDTFQFTVTATDSGYLGGWVEYFHRLAAAQRAQIAREDETLFDIRLIEEGVLCTDELVFEGYPPESRIGFMQIGTGEIGALIGESPGGSPEPGVRRSRLLLLLGGGSGTGVAPSPSGAGGGRVLLLLGGGSGA